MTTAAEKKALAEQKKADAKAARDAKAAEKASRNNGGGDDVPGLAQVSTTSETPPSDQVNTIAQPPVEDPDRAPVEGEDNIGFKMKGGRNPDPNAEEESTDKKWSIASRARWGASDSNSTQQHKDAREVERSLADQE